MTIDGKALFLFFLGLLVLWFVYATRAILTPFILAAIFAYLFNPIVDFFSEKMKFPRAISILLIYCLLIALFVVGSIILSSRVIEESSELKSYTNHILTTAHSQLESLPDWIRPTAYDFLFTLRRSRWLNFFETPSFFPFVSQAITRVVSFLIFLFSAFYFLKDGKSFFATILQNIPKVYKSDVQTLFQKINALLSGYLRGQIFLVFLMAIVTYIALTILGIRFAAIIAIFSGFAEIVPVIGPIIAAGLAVAITLFTGTANFGLSPLNASFIVIVIYFVFRHLEDYFVTPYVMGKITKLPAFIIFFSVIAGGHIAGLLGLILAVPFAAVVNLLLTFYFGKLNAREKNE